MFAEKLNLLMNITGTSNTDLSEAAGLDASHISRLRRGERELPRHQNFIWDMSLYFTEQATAEYQKSALREAICPGQAWPQDKRKAAELLSNYLATSRQSNQQTIDRFLDGFSSFTPPNFSRILPQKFSAPSARASSYYYGIAGKQQAFIRFLKAVLAQEQPQTLLLYSDEQMDWLTDKNFSEIWSSLLMRVLQNGNRLKIVLVTSRSSQELLTGISNWLPLYLSGSIEPYYNPQASACNLRNTILVAPKTAAITANSVEGNKTDNLHIYLTDPAAIAAVDAELSDYFNLCRPLVRIFTPDNSTGFYTMIDDFAKQCAPTIIAHSTPSIMTMPYQLATSISKRLNNDNLRHHYNKAAEIFKQQLEQGFCITQIINPPRRRDIDKAQIDLPLSALFNHESATYKPDELREHLRYLIELMQQYENFSVIFNNNIIDNMLIIGKEKTGTLVARKTAPTSLLSIFEPNMTEAFWLYLQSMQGKIHKTKTILQIEKLL